MKNEDKKLLRLANEVTIRARKITGGVSLQEEVFRSPAGMVGISQKIHDLRRAVDEYDEEILRRREKNEIFDHFKR